VDHESTLKDHEKDQPGRGPGDARRGLPPKRQVAASAWPIPLRREHPVVRKLYAVNQARAALNQHHPGPGAATHSDSCADTKTQMAEDAGHTSRWKTPSGNSEKLGLAAADPR